MKAVPSSFRPLWRLLILALVLMAGFLALVIKLIDLSVFKHHFLQKEWAERVIRTLPVHAHRGMILDRNGIPLAISTEVYAVCFNAAHFSMTADQQKTLAKLLGLLPHTLEKEINKKRSFIYLKRNVSPPQAALIKALRIQGLFLEKQYKRFYPQGDTFAPVIGMTNIDDQGQEGIERLYNAWLCGKSGLRKTMKDRYGNEIADLGWIIPPLPGNDLTLSIDDRLQYMAYHALLDALKTFDAQYGGAVILNARTGELLALANAPSFNPNARLANEKAYYRNRCLTDTFEPGSTLKTFAMVLALSQKKLTPETLINTSPGYYYVEGKKISDDGHNEGVINLTKILEVSSNVGISKIILMFHPYLYINLLHQMGFTQPTGIYFPGENTGMLNKNALHSAFVYATLSFGYGISANLVQLAAAYAILANDGVKVPLSLLKITRPPAGTSIISPQTAAQIRAMLASVVMEGTMARAARIPGYTIIGKTGTARLLGPHGYDKYHHNSFFVGMAGRPDIVVAVFIHNPLKKAYLGGFVAGPVFAKIMSESLSILNIPPDAIDHETVG